MSISAAEAAKLTGLSKQAVINAINSGKISAVKDVDGRWSIEPVELFRHYQPASSTNGKDHPELDEARQSLDTPSVDTLQVEVQLLRERLHDKEAALVAANDQIQDLRRRLDTEADQNQQLVAMLAALTPPQPQPQRRNWWARLLGGGE